MIRESIGSYAVERQLGTGGIALVERATGISYSTNARGIRELEEGRSPGHDRIRRPGAGRKRKADLEPRLLIDLESLVEPTASGDPQSSLRWTSKSVRTLAKRLQGMGHKVSRTLVGELLHEPGSSLQANRKAKEGTTHPDRSSVRRGRALPVRAGSRRRSGGRSGR